MPAPWLCVHGHFYQPPRENPWLERVEVQDSAAPFHDWNQRITAECYAPVSAARILDPAGRIAQIINLYSSISFDFGPTLLSWLESHAPETYAGILEADRNSARRFGGHGSALAQAYNHTILPLAPHRDKVTQVRWGIADFEHRFRHRPEGLWLPETAADLATLEVVAAEGISFTILAPHQARRIRRPRGGWEEVGPRGVDPRRPYLVRLPSGRSLTLFFYHGSVARAVAFERLLSSGDTFLTRLLGVADPAASGDQLVHIATDGETYGHHHRFGEMALAWALREAERRGLARLTNYGEYLELHPPTWEVELAENTSWSCAHGVERWRSDCGCRLTGDTSQAWRRPLREALEWLRGEADGLFEGLGSQLFKDPWAARDGAVVLHLDPTPARRASFLAQHARRVLDPQEEVQALTLLELQRHAQLMFTSCGWFFDDIAGLEAVQVMRYAARAAELAERLSGKPLVNALERRLAAAPGNDPTLPDGGAVFRERVRPHIFTLPQLGARAALLTLFPDDGQSVPSVEITQTTRRETSGSARLASGRLQVVARATAESAEFAFAAVHCGDHTALAGVTPSSPLAGWERELEEIHAAFRRADVAAVVRRIDGDMAHIVTLAELPPDDRRWALGRIVASAVEDARAVYRTLYHAHAQLLSFIKELGVPAPPELASAAASALEHALVQELRRLPGNPRPVEELLVEARRLGLEPRGEELRRACEGALARAMAAVAAAPGAPEPLQALIALVQLLPRFPVPIDRWWLETQYWALRSQQTEESIDEAWRNAFSRLGELLGFAPPG